MNMQSIGVIYNDFPTKFGLPRQSGMSEHLLSRIVMEDAYRSPEAFRGIESFEYLWLIWEFEPMGSREWSPTVRPPKLGGNKRMGVFATRSPNRPNPIGLTRVKLVKADLHTPDGPILIVSGADLMNETKILDIKPYLPFADSVPEALSGAYGPAYQKLLNVVIPPDVAAIFSEQQLLTLREVLAYDPRPGYRSDDDTENVFAYAGYDLSFRVEDDTLTVTKAVKLAL